MPVATLGVGWGLVRVRAAHHGDPPGAHHFLHAERPDDLDKIFDFRRRAGHLDDHGVVAHVDDLCVEDAGYRDDLGPAWRRRVDLHQHHLALDGWVVGYIADLQDL